MKETVRALRNLILKKMNNSSTFGFSPKNVSDREFAKHPGGDNSADDPDHDENTWESYLYTRNDIRIILSINRGRQSANAVPAVILNGKKFRSVSLFIYDGNQIDIQCSKQTACTALEQEISKTKNGIYEIMKITERCIQDPSGRKSKTKAVGHVLDLKIRNTGKPWEISRDLSSDQFEKAADDLVKKVAATLTDLLPAAQYYADNQKKLLSE